MKNWNSLLVAALLSACGGGGDGPAVGNTPANAIFPLKAAYTAFAKAGQSYNYGLSGTCGGHASQISAPAASTTYNALPAFVKTTTINLTISSCMAAPGTSGTLPPVGTRVSTQQIFYDPNFKPIAYVVQGVGTLNIVDNFTIPETVKVGDAGVMGSGGGFSMSYTVAPETETTAIVKLNIQMPNGSLISGTEVQTFRISTGGEFSLLADEFFTSGGYRFTLTPR